MINDRLLHMPMEIMVMKLKLTISLGEILNLMISKK